MCAENQFYSSMEHYLLSILGRRWNKVYLAMVTIYIDDSGTAPEHNVAIASALIVQSSRIVDLDKELDALSKKEGFSFFHTSACVAGNSKSDFRDWELPQKERVCSAMRGIAMKYGIQAFSVAIEKGSYDEIVPSHLKEQLGKFHYTWAVGYLIEMLSNWQTLIGLEGPLEYVFDWMGEDKRNPRKHEIESVMDNAELNRPGQYDGHYAFRHGRLTPGLQCADIMAWSSYQLALFALTGKTPSHIGGESFAEFSKYRDGAWLRAIVQTREQLKKWVSEQDG